MRRSVLLVLLLVASCGSPPTRFYTLASEPADRTASDRCLDGPLVVRHVLLPATLDRQSIVRALGPDRLDISNQDRWAAPLDGMIQRVLADDLRDRLPSGEVLAPGDPTPASGALGLEVDVGRFLADPTGRVVLEADWTLIGTNGKPTARRSETVSSPGGTDADQMVAGMSSAIGVLADHVAAALCPRTGLRAR